MWILLYVYIFFFFFMQCQPSHSFLLGTMNRYHNGDSAHGFECADENRMADILRQIMMFSLFLIGMGKIKADYFFLRSLLSPNNRKHVRCAIFSISNMSVTRSYTGSPIMCSVISNIHSVVVWPAMWERNEHKLTYDGGWLLNITIYAHEHEPMNSRRHEGTFLNVIECL